MRNSVLDFDESGASNQTSIAQMKSDNKITGPLSEFPSFSKLPKELRLMIWNQHATLPRIVQVNLSSHKEDVYKPDIYSPNGTPVLLHVNYESRSETLRHNTLVQFSENSSGYMNLEIDTALINRRGQLFATINRNRILLDRFFLPDVFTSKIRNIALNITNGPKSSLVINILGLSTRCDRIDELVLVKVEDDPNKKGPGHGQEMVWLAKEEFVRTPYQHAEQLKDPGPYVWEQLDMLLESESNAWILGLSDNAKRNLVDTKRSRGLMGVV